MELRRYISQPFVDALNAVYGGDNGEWWRGLLADPDIFLAFRREAINAYYRGCSLAQVRLIDGEVRTYTHYKYVIHPSLPHPMVEGRSGNFVIPQSWREAGGPPFVNGLSDLGLLKRAATPFAGGEKTFVADIIRNNDAVFDVEIALSRSAEENEDADASARRGADRIDIAALRPSKSGIDLVFFEAKLFGNKELRARGGAPAQVIGQIDRYIQLLGAYRDAIRSSALLAAENVLQLNGMPAQRKAQANDLLAAADRFCVDTDPVLVVGGFDADQRAGSVWKAHQEKLLAALKGRVITAGNGANVKLTRHPRP